MASTNRDEISRLELLHAAHPDGLVFPHLADAYRRAGRYAQAESVLNAGLRQHADYSSAHVVLGRLRLDQGKRREAENAFQRVLQLDPQNHVALEFLGRLAAEESRLEEALGYLRRLATLKPAEELADQIEELERRIHDAGMTGSARSRRLAAESAEALSNPPEPSELEPSELEPSDSTAPDSTASEPTAPESTASEPTASEPTAPRSTAPESTAASPASGGAARANGGDGRGPVDPGAGAPGPVLVGSADEPVGDELPEPGEVVTETMAELYTRQGLLDRAQAVYRQLLARDPGNPRLEEKLRQATARLENRRADADSPADEGEPPAAPEVVPEAAPTKPAIRAYMAGLLSWSAEGGDGAEPDPGAGTTVGSEVGGAEVGAEVEAEVGAEVGSHLGAEVEGEAEDPFEDEAESETRDAGAWEPWATAPVSEPEETGSAGPREAVAESAVSESAVSGSTGEARPTRPDDPAAVGPRADSPASTGASDPEPERRTRPGATPSALGLVEPDLEEADSQTRALLALTDMLVGLLEYRDPFFRGSTSLTRLLSMNVAEEMGLDEGDRVNLALAAVLRDLGRLALGGRLVESQKLSKTPEARRKIERHVDLALQLLEGIDLPRDVTLAVRHHHEWWDGAGYPDGLAGQEIPRLARVLAAVDSFAAMVSPRPYRLPRKVPEAARELEAAAGTQYDPAVVDALLRVLDRRNQPHLGFVQRHHILLVNQDQPGAVVTAAKLCSAGYLAEVAVDADTARERLRRVPVAALVVSAEGEPDAPEDLIRELRLDPLFASLPIVVVDAGTVALRVRLLENGADVCFPPGISYGELQGTLGALVRRTLRSREARPETGDEEAPWLALQGDIQDFPLAWLLQVMKYDSRTAGIGIRTSTEQGAIYIDNGDAVHAQIRAGPKGEDALKQMLQWRKGRFTVQPDAQAKERSIESSIMHLLLTQAVEEDHAAAGVFGAVSDSG